MIHLTDLGLPLLGGRAGEDGVDEAVVFIDLRGGDAGLFTGVDDEANAASPHLDGLAEANRSYTLRQAPQTRPQSHT